MRLSGHLLVGCLFVMVTIATPALADHPGSNQGMLRYLTDPTFADVAVDGLVHHQTDVDLTFAEWETLYPEFVERFTIGKTSSGVDLLGIKITDEAIMPDAADTAEGTKYKVYLDGGHHGNEYLGVELVMYYLEEKLTKLAAGDAGAVEFFATHEIYAVPIINVDGNTADTRKNSNQVDVNRNYPFQWGGPGSGDLPAELNYRGPAPMSEDEVRANAEFGAELRPDLWITMHTGVAEFYWPWGWTFDKSPDWVMFEKLEAPFENATNGEVDAMMAAELYLAAGATDDYGYGEVGVPTFTYEVHDDQFIPIYGQPIPNVIADQLAGLDFMVENTKFLGARLQVGQPFWGEATEVTANYVVSETAANVPTFSLHNFGWGNATNLTITFDGSDVTGEDLLPASLLANLPAGWVTDIAVPDGATAVQVTYDPLYVESAQPRTVTYTFTEADLAVVSHVEAAGAISILPLLAAIGIAFMMRKHA